MDRGEYYDVEFVLRDYLEELDKLNAVINNLLTVEQRIGFLSTREYKSLIFHEHGLKLLGLKLASKKLAVSINWE